MEKATTNKKDEYIRIDEIPEDIASPTNIDIRILDIKQENNYVVYKCLDIDDIDILITNSHRIDEPWKKIEEMQTLSYYMDPDNKEEYSKLNSILNSVSNDEINEIENKQKEFIKSIPSQVKYSKDYLWQIYYIQRTNRYVMIVPTEDSDYSTFFYLFKIKIENKRNDMVFDALGGELRFVVSGGAPADSSISKAFTSLGVRTVQGYGLTETSPVIAAEDEKHIKYGTVGLPMVNVKIKIDNPDENGIGEIKIKGPNVMLGYYEMPEETKKVLKNGWFYTGDLGFIDKKGYLTLVGRNKDMIVLKNGKKVFPEEIEMIINRLDEVEECMVFGIPDKRDKSNIRLAVKVVYNKDFIKEKYPFFEEKELEVIIWNKIKEINKTFPPYKYIKHFILTDKELIKTSPIKIKRHEEMKTIII